MNLPALATIDTFRNRVFRGDALTLLGSLPDASVDLLLTDPPYGTTALEWDTAPDLPALWDALKRVMKPRGAVVMTASQPFTSELVMSNRKWFRYEWIWTKTMAFGFLDANRKPLKAHESVLVFGAMLPSYFPQMTKGKPYVKKRNGGNRAHHYGEHKGTTKVNKGERYPQSVIKFKNGHAGKSLHPAQKPVDLFAYLIKTYTRPDALVVDPYAGGGTTAVAAVATGRDFIIGDMSAEYCEIARKRLAQGVQLEMFAEVIQ